MRDRFRQPVTVAVRWEYEVSLPFSIERKPGEPEPSEDLVAALALAAVEEAFERDAKRRVNDLGPVEVQE